MKRVRTIIGITTLLLATFAAYAQTIPRFDSSPR